MYAAGMKRLRIRIDDELDEALGRRARAEGASRAALIRRFVRRHVTALPALEDDAPGRWIGGDAFGPESVNDVVYR